MKYSFMTFSCPQATWQQVLALAKQFGYDGVEPRAQSDHAHGVEVGADAGVRRRLRTQAERAGVAVACIATSCRYADPAGAAGAVEQTRGLIDLAADMGCPRLRVFGGEFPKTVSRQEAMQSLVRSLQAVGDAAQKKKVTLCVETHDAWCDPRLVAEVMRQVNHPAVGVNWDIMHPVRAGGAGMQEAYDLLKPWVRHVHVHDGLLALDKITMLPTGTGQIDHRLALGLLRRDGYDGFVSGEWIAGMMSPEFYADHLGPELAGLKRLEREAGQ